MMFLKAWLAFIVLTSAWTVYCYGETIEDLVSHSDPRWDGDLSWALPMLLGLGLAGLVVLCVMVNHDWSALR